MCLVVKTQNHPNKPKKYIFNLACYDFILQFFLIYRVKLFLGEWWKEDVMQVLSEFVASGGAPRDSDAYTINGQPGDFYPCSSQG